MARRGAPALYELMRRPNDADASAGKPGSAPRGPSSLAGASRRNSGGSATVIEVPQLWAVILAVAVVLMVAIAYSIGVSRGRALAGAASGPNPADVSSQVPALGPQPTPPAAGTETPSAMRRTPSSTDNNADPRVKGYRYYVLAHPSSDRAAGMVEFCRGNGLDAYLVPDDNALLRKIIVLPGYKDASEKNSPEIKALEATIRRVGEKWKGVSRGNKDFSDAFLEFYR